jgi:hypothetical protein
LTARSWLVEFFEDGGASFLPGSAFEHEWLHTCSGEVTGERVEMFGPLGKYEHVAPAPNGVEHIVSDEPGSEVVLNEGSEHVLDRGDSAEAGGAGRVVYHQSPCQQRAGGVSESDLMANRTALHGDDRLETVSTVWRRGQAEPSPCGGVAHGELE